MTLWVSSQALWYLFAFGYSVKFPPKQLHNRNAGNSQSESVSGYYEEWNTTSFMSDAYCEPRSRRFGPPNARQVPLGILISNFAQTPVSTPSVHGNVSAHYCFISESPFVTAFVCFFHEFLIQSVTLITHASVSLRSWGISLESFATFGASYQIFSGTCARNFK